MLINRAKKNAIYTVNKVKKKSILNSEHYRTLYKRKVKGKLLFFFKLTSHVKIGETVNLKWLPSWFCYVTTDWYFDTG